MSLSLFLIACAGDDDATDASMSLDMRVDLAISDQGTDPDTGRVGDANTVDTQRDAAGDLGEVDIPDALTGCEATRSELTRMVENKISEYRSRAFNCPPVVAPGTSGLRPEDFGAMADGTTDDTDAIAEAIVASQTQNTYVVLESAKTYLISSMLRLKPGTRGLITSGAEKATLKATAALTSNMAIFQSSSQPANISDAVVQNIRFDAEASDTVNYGIFGQNGQRLGIYDNEILNSRDGGGIYIAGYEGMGQIEDICITGNTVNVTDGATSGKEGIQIRGYNFGGERFAVTEHWSENADILPFAINARRINVHNNSVTGGRYGVAMLNCDDSNVTDNMVRDNTRNLRFGTGSDRLLVDNNIGRNAASTSILFGYVSHDNVVTNNDLQTSRASSWGMIETTIGIERNIYAFNTLSSPTASPSHHYGIYLALHANDNLIFDNNISGHYSKAYIALESSHAANPDPRHRTGAGGYTWQQDGSRNNRIVANRIDPLQLTTPAIFLSQASETLENTTLACNIVTQDTDPMIHRLEATVDGTKSGDQAMPFQTN